MTRPLPSDGGKSAVAETATLQKKRAAAPEYADLTYEFGSEGLQRDAKGTITGYRYPEIVDPQKRKRRDAKVLEMWERHRRVSTEIGGEFNARRQSMTLVDRKTGKSRTVPAEQAERLARKAGLVERTHYGKSRTDVFGEFLSALDPHERYAHGLEMSDGWHWTARLGGRHGDVVETGVAPTKAAARERAFAVLRALDLPELEPLHQAAAGYVH